MTSSTLAAARADDHNKLIVAVVVIISLSLLTAIYVLHVSSDSQIISSNVASRCATKNSERIDINIHCSVIDIIP